MANVICSVTRLMPCLKYIIQNANTNELKLLRGKTIECVSLIGLAVGNEKVSLVGIGSIERRFFIMAIIKLSLNTVFRDGRIFLIVCVLKLNWHP